jgi:DNA-binding NarL/FixJ family response regulator
MNAHTTRTMTRVGYILALIGFFQVGAAVAPHVAETLPFGGWSAYALGWGIAAVFDLTWATIGYSAIRTHQQGNHRATVVLATVTAAVIAASTALLATVGHQGPWSFVPAVSALIIGISAALDHVLIDNETHETIRKMRANSRAALALALAESRRDSLTAETETIRALANGRATIARKTAESRILAEMRIQGIETQAAAVTAIETVQEKHGETAARFSEILAGQTPTLILPDRAPETIPNEPETTPARALTVISNAADLSETDRKILAMVREGKKAPEIAETLEIGLSTTYRKISQLRTA